MEPTEHIIVIAHTEHVRMKLHASYGDKGMELINSSHSSLIYRWYNAPKDALTAIAALPEYEGTVSVRQENADKALTIGGSQTE